MWMASKVVVITGASSGIGAALATLLAERGHSVVVVARRQPALDAVVERCHGRARAVVADVSRRDEVKRIVAEALEAFGRIDVWINNVGQGITRAPSELTDDDIDEMMQINVKSALYGIQEVLPHFKERGDGHIINVSSLLGRMPMAVIRSAYCGAKHFLNALTATLREELKEAYPGIQISLVSPPVVATNFGRNARHGGPDSRSFGEAQNPEETAEVMASVIDSRAPDVYTRRGSRDWVIGYYSRVGSDPQ